MPRKLITSDIPLHASSLSRICVRRWTILEIVVLTTVLAIALIHLPQPFQDDQAFYTVGALKISHGSLLYRDYWDIKQPGIFWFYAVAGKLFGFTEIGIHTFEMLYMMLFGLTLIVTLLSYFEERWTSSLVVLLTIGFYYGISGLPHSTQDYLTQVEGLVAVPMFLSLWFVSKNTAANDQYQSTRLFLSGVSGGLVLVLKVILFPIVLSFWAAAFAFSQPWQRRRFQTMFCFALPILLGLALPISLTCAYFAERGGLRFLYFTTFVWPVGALHTLPLAGPGRLNESLQFFIGGFAPLFAFGLVGTWACLRRRRNLMTMNLLLWIVIGFIVILVQRRSWWPYHFLLLVVPFGILASNGIEYLWRQLRASDLPREAQAQYRIVLITSLILGFAPVLYPSLADALRLSKYNFAISRDQRLKYQCRYPYSQYAAVLSDIEILATPHSVPGPIYVGGSPLLYFLSGRTPAISLSYGLDDFLPEQWDMFSKELSVKKPPYIFLSPLYDKWIGERSPQTLQFITSYYDIVQVSDQGTWYLLKTIQQTERK